MVCCRSICSAGCSSWLRLSKSKLPRNSVVSLRYLLLSAVVGMAGCASDPAPFEQMRLTERALEQAAAVGATTSTQEYRLAEERFALAKKNMQEQDYRRARMLAEQAELDARLAEALTLRGESEQAITVQNARIERLRKQLGSLR
ncbi:hypothetical protein DBO85_03225 [Pseudomonas mangrovi]|uniref:DUF4398 domain-containing protein n=2 Tax=Pseudomonas mangrovi TaxID=2161748 RepID=A0A2T5PDA5_9PSED|nr:hypothetical protein DBO85_03225 [Pseudomonas mangrovi]